MATIHVISHTHWDREWYRPFQSFRLKLVHLIDGLLDLLEKDPQFKYFMLDGQTIVLDDYLAMCPEKEAILRKYIQQRRILIGPWHILPDMFLVGPESHIRNLLRGDQTSRRFGPKMRIGYIPDPFGHPGQVPQILRGFGIDTACLWRGLDEEPAEFWWESPDGSQVMMAYLRDSYSNGASLPADNPALFAESLQLAADSLAAHSAVDDYLIMYGTDHMEPPTGTSKAIAYSNKALEGVRVLHSTLPKYVESIQSKIRKQNIILPVVSGELRACKRSHLLPGVLSTRMWIKQRNRAAENLMTKWVEPFNIFAAVSSSAHNQSNIINKAWMLLMENHPHDSICGCSIDQVHNEMRSRFDQVDQIGEDLARQSLEVIAANIETESPGGLPAVVVFNPSSASRTDVVLATLELPPRVEDFELLDDQGSILPHQAFGYESRELVNMNLDAKGLQSAFGSINDGKVAGMSIQEIHVKRLGSQVQIEAILMEGGEPNRPAWTAGRNEVDRLLEDRTITEYLVRAHSLPSTKIIFTAANIPGLGYRTFWLRPLKIQEKPAVRMNGLIVKMLTLLTKLPLIEKLAKSRTSSRPPYRIENGFFSVEIKGDGTLSILDKMNNRRYEGMNHFVDGGDCGDEYNYAPPVMDKFISPKIKRVIVKKGPVQQSIQVELELMAPKSLAVVRDRRSKETVKIHIITGINLINDVPRVDITTSVDNQANDHRLRVHFPAPFSATSGNQDGAFEVVERKIGVPAFDQTWIEQPRPEVPQMAFTDVSDRRIGLMVANRGLPEVEVLKNDQGNAEIALTLLRCVGWLSRDDFATRKGHAGPFMETPEAQMPGKWKFEYSIIPHADGWQSAYNQAYAFETTLGATMTGSHGGSLPPCGSFVQCSPEEFVVTAVKESEDHRGWLLRGYNITRDVIQVSLKPWKRFRKGERVNLAEEKLGDLRISAEGEVNFAAKGHEICSVLFRP